MKYDNLERALREYSEALQLLLKNKVPVASGNLKSSINVKVNKFGSTYRVICKIDEVYKYIEEGRKPGSFPPIDKLIQWIKVKPVIPRPNKGKLPTTEQLAFLIARSIKDKGIKPKPFIKDSVDIIHKRFEERIENAIKKDCETYIINKIKLITK